MKKYTTVLPVPVVKPFAREYEEERLNTTVIPVVIGSKSIEEKQNNRWHDDT